MKLDLGNFAACLAMLVTSSYVELYAFTNFTFDLVALDMAGIFKLPVIESPKTSIFGSDEVVGDSEVEGSFEQEGLSVGAPVVGGLTDALGLDDGVEVTGLDIDVCLD